MCLGLTYLEKIGRSINIRFAFLFGKRWLKTNCALQTGCDRQNNGSPKMSTS